MKIANLKSYQGQVIHQIKLYMCTVLYTNNNYYMCVLTCNSLLHPVQDIHV